MKFPWFKKAMAAIDPLPDPFAQPDQTNHALTMDYLIGAMGENTAVPRIGDVIIKITDDSMGMSVRRDDRYRVIGPGVKTNASTAVMCEHAVTGATERLHVFYMRQHTNLARTWWLLG